MARTSGPAMQRASLLLVIAILGMIVVPAALTLHRVRVSQGAVPGFENPVAVNPSPYGYTVSLLLFIVPILVIGLWFLPRDGVKIAKKSFAWTIGLLFPLGAGLDFFCARYFFTFPNPGATLRMPAPALGGPVPVEEYVFYFTGFVAVLLLYIWLDEYWLAAYAIPVTAAERTDFARLLRFHPLSLLSAAVLIGAAVLYRHQVLHLPGVPGYFILLVLGGLLPSAALLPSALPVINWRSFSLTSLFILLVSLLWEATLGLPYGWWGFQDAQMIGIHITAWSRLPVEEVFVWIAVTYATVIVYEVVRCWKASGKRAKHAFLGCA